MRSDNMNSNKIKDRLERLFSKKYSGEDLQELNSWYDNLLSEHLKKSDSEKAKKAVWIGFFSLISMTL